MTEKNEARVRTRAPMGTHWYKTLLSLVLAAVMMVSLLPVTALATETSAASVKVVTKVVGRSYHLGASGFDAPDYGRPNDYKSRPEIEIMKITFEDGTTMVNPSKDVIHTLDGSDAKNWWRLADDNVTWEDYSMTAYPKFIEGTYRYVVKLRVDSDENAKYQFADHVDIEITDEYHGEMFWKAEAEGTFSSQRYITSPNYTVDEYGYLIDNTRIEGKQLSIGETNEGVPIKEIDLNSSVMGGTKPYKFEKTEDSPAWIKVSEDGKVSGTPTGTTDAATELKVKVTDSGTPAKTVTLTIPVGRTFPATDERIDLAYVQVELKDVLPALGASTDLFPGFTLVKAVTKDKEEIKADQIPDNAIVFQYAMGNMGCWQKWNAETGRYEGYYKTTFEDPGTYRFGMLLRIQNTGTIAFGEQYKLADSFNVQMLKNGESLPTEKQWKVRNAWSFETYSTVELISPDYEVNNDWRDLKGNVEITCTVRTGEPISTHVSGCNAPAGNLRYQWQKQSAKDGSWSNWGKLTESGSMSGNMVQADDPGEYGTGAVRVIVSAVGYEGKLISAPRPINPAVHTEEPSMPKLWYLADKDVIFVRNPIGYKQQQDYLLSKTPMTQAQLDEAPERTGTETPPLGCWTNYGDVSIVSDKNVFKAEGNTLYYVYTRLAGGRGYLAGKEYRYSTIYTGDSGSLVDLARLVLDGYTSYGVGNTIYIPINGTVTINVKKEPENASTWQIICLKAYAVDPSETGKTVPFSIVTGAEEKTEIAVNADGQIPESITLKAGAAAGTGHLGAFYPSSSGDYGSSYGKWDVVVYNPDNITNFGVVNLPVYSDVKLDVGDTYTPTNAMPTITTRPEGALDGYELKWYARVGTGTAGNPVFIPSDESHKNEFISVDKNTGVVTALKVHGEGNDIYKQVALYAIKGSTQKYLASYSVTVEAAAAQEGVLLVNPGSLSIEKGETASLTAQVVGLPEGAGESSYEWKSGETKVAAVSEPVPGGNKAEVKAIGHGDTTIKVTYKYSVEGAKKVLSAAVPVSVHQWGEWQKLDENTHRRECEKCSAVETENHYPTAEGGSSIQPGEGGKTVWKCNACGYTWDNSAYHTVKLDANGGTVTPDYALVSDVGRIGFLPTPERSGYSFSGWYTEKTGGTKVTGDTVVGASVSTLYAHWIADYHNDDNSGGNHYDRRQNSAANAGTGSGTTNKPVKSPGTGDPGVMLYAAMGLLSLSGGAWVVGRKRKDK